MSLNRAVTDTHFNHSNFSPGRPWGAADKIVIHHWGADGQAHEGVVKYLANTNNHGASAHYVASGGRVTQLVHDYDRAWHAGQANSRSIGIECRPEKSAADFSTVAKLVAAIWEQHGYLPLYRHKDFMATACPGRWDPVLPALEAEAKKQLQRFKEGSFQQKKQAQKTVRDTKLTGFKPLVVDGIWGKQTTLGFQLINGTTPDGVISSQTELARQTLGAAMGTGWEIEPAATAEGSLLIRSLGNAFKVVPDGFVGPEFRKGMARYYRLPENAPMTEVVKAAQWAINRQLTGGAA